MKGSNTLSLNPSTMMEAIQFYLNECLFASDGGVEVKSVVASDCSSLATFKVVFAKPAVEAKR